LSSLNHFNTFIEINAERAFCKKLKSGCHIPIGSYAVLKKKKIWLRGLVGSPDGEIILKGERFGWYNIAEEMGYSLAKELLNNGAKRILGRFYTKKIKLYMKILVTRPSPEGEELVNNLNNVGIFSSHISLFDFYPSEGKNSIPKKVYALYKSDIIVIFSKKSIYYINTYLKKII
jgi:hypothetical protein